MEAEGIVKGNEAPESNNLAQTSMQFIVSGEELLIPTPASAGETPDGTKVMSPIPISSSTPLTGEFSGSKRGGRSYDFKDDGTSFSPGSHFKHQNFTVNSGEDVAARIFLLAQEFPAISIISGSGPVSTFTLRMLGSSGETSIFEGSFELLSLNGTFLPTQDGRRAGKVAVTLACRDGRVIGGELAGSLVAAGPVKVAACSFRPQKQHMKKNKGKEIA